MRLKLQLLAPSQPETPITTVVVVDVGKGRALRGIIEQSSMADARPCQAMMDETHAKIECEGEGRLSE